MVYLPGFAGINGGVFGSPAAWVDTSKKPGMTSQVQELGFRNSMKQILTLRYFYFSPNLIWFLMALAMHLVFPYEIETAKLGWNLAWALRRLALNMTVALSYYAFFYVGLFHLGWAHRKYAPHRYPTFGNMVHNIYYWSLGVLQWTAFECVVMRLWATGKVPFVTNEQVLNDHHLLFKNILWVLLIPIWRDLHFYIAHRFIHIRAIYKFVHSLHHRNSDPEPFSGMTMHPVEHLYYFSNALIPTLYLEGRTRCSRPTLTRKLGLSPLIFLWCFVHLSIAPGAGTPSSTAELTR